MEVSKIFAIGFLISLCISFSEEQGSPAAAIGAYITLYKERKRQKLEREKNRTRRPSSTTEQRPTPTFICKKYPFYYSTCWNHYSYYPYHYF
jgi:hypothetical protein